MADFVIRGPAAVLVIDAQRAFFEADPPPDAAGAVLRAICNTVGRARAGGANVFYIQHDGSAEDGVVPDSEGWQLHPELPVEPGDTVLRKRTCDAFQGTELEAALRRLQIRTVVLMGYATDFCINATLQNAISRGFETVVVEDGHTTNDSPHLPAAKLKAHLNWAWANCTVLRPVSVIPSARLRFEPPPKA